MALTLLFFSLDFSFARVVVGFFIYHGGLFLTTAEFLMLYEDELSGINSMVSSRIGHDYQDKGIYISEEEEDELVEEIKEEDKEYFQKKRIEFREKTERFKDWPLPQFIFSALYRYMVFEACTAQSRLWDCLVGDGLESQKIRDAYEAGDENSVMLALDEYTRYVSSETFTKEKEVRVIDSTFWSGHLKHIIFLEGNKSLSLGVMALFSDFASRNNGLDRETGLKTGILSMFRHARFSKDWWNLVDATFFSFVVIPLLEIIGVLPLDARLAALQYIETKEVEPFNNRLKDEPFC